MIYLRRIVGSTMVFALGVFGASAPASAQAARYEAPTAAPAGKAQIVKITEGTLEGAVADGVGWFLGIPYAPPPVGDMRWRPPGEPLIWTGVRDAKAAGASCATQEDCLFLNVVRPEDAKPGQKLPVMVWIHGGGFANGSSMGGFGGDTDGHAFASQGIINVSVNYRLGRAGWFSHPALMKEGRLHSNYGLMDQIAALKWVKAHIAQFGGDPGNVTIFGESAGGASVLYLMISPEARGLFSKVIAESSYGRYVPNMLATDVAAGIELARAAGIEGDDAAAAAALRKLPLSALPVPPRAAPGRGAPGGGGRPYPVIDGALIPSSIMQAFEAGTEAKVPLIIGGNSNEANRTRPTPEMLDAIPAEQRAIIMKVFDPTGAGDRNKIINDFVTVQDMTEPDRAVVRLHTAHGAPSWTYFFDYVPLVQRPKKPLGAGHTQEIPFVFMSPKSLFAPEDLPVATAVNAAWAAFAKTGDPAKGSAVPWPRWTPEKEGQVVFAAGGAKAQDHFMKLQRDTAESMLTLLPPTEDRR